MMNNHGITVFLKFVKSISFEFYLNLNVDLGLFHECLYMGKISS